jgi:hypothetical protein
VLPTTMLRKRMGYGNKRDISKRSTSWELYEAGSNSQMKNRKVLTIIASS